MAGEKINEEARKQIRTFFRQLNMMYGVFLASLFLFLISMLLIGNMLAQPLNPQYETFLLFGAPLSSGALIIIAGRLYNGRISKVDPKSQLWVKMEHFRSASVLRMIILDGAAFIELISFAMTFNKVFIAVCVVIITIFIFYKPSMEKFIRELALTSVEARVMRDHSS